jgi:hypothetical protein
VSIFSINLKTLNPSTTLPKITVSPSMKVNGAPMVT